MHRNVLPTAVVILLVAGTAASGLVGSAGAQPETEPALRVATVDFVRLFESHPTLVTGKEELQRSKDATAQELRRMEEGLEAIRAELSMLDPASDAFRDKGLEFELDKLRYQHRITVEEQALQKANLKLLRRAIDEIEQAVRKVALERGLTVVLQKSRFRFSGETEEELFSRVAVRGVVWADEALDITSAVLERLGEE